VKVTRLFRLLLPSVILAFQAVSFLRAEDEQTEQSQQAENRLPPSESTDPITPTEEVTNGNAGRMEGAPADKEDDLTPAERQQYRADKAKIHNAPELVEARKVVHQTTGDKSAAIVAKWETKETLILNIDPLAGPILEKKEAEHQEKKFKN
jgi:hypothetical protein